MSYILTGFSGGQTECFSVFSNVNFADAVMLLQGAVGFSDLVNEQIQHTFLIPGKTICRLSQLIWLDNPRAIFTFFVVYNRYFRHDRSMLSVTGFKIVTLYKTESTGMDNFVKSNASWGQFVTGLRATCHRKDGYLRVICHTERAVCHRSLSESRIDKGLWPF